MNRKNVLIAAAVILLGTTGGLAYKEFIHAPRAKYESTVNHLMENTGISRDQAEDYAQFGVDKSALEYIVNKNVPLDQLESYLEAGMHPYLIPEAISEGISEDLAKEYVKLGIKNKGIVILVKGGFTPELVQKFAEREKENGLNPTDIADILERSRILQSLKGNWFTGETYKAWSSTGYSFITMRNSNRKGISIEEALKWANAGFTEESFKRLVLDYKVPLEDIQLILAEHVVGSPVSKKVATNEPIPKAIQTYEFISKIIQLYAEKTGTTMDERRGYLDSGIHDPNIKILAEKGITPHILRNIRLKNDIIIQLAKDGTFTGDIYAQWISEGVAKYMEVSFSEGYSLEETKQWAEAGIIPHGMRVLKTRGVDLASAINGVAAGLNSDEMLKALSMHQFADKHYQKLEKR